MSDKVFNEFWHKKLESAQYISVLAITVNLRTNAEKLLGIGFRVLAKQM